MIIETSKHTLKTYTCTYRIVIDGIGETKEEAQKNLDDAILNLNSIADKIIDTVNNRLK